LFCYCVRTALEMAAEQKMRLDACSCLDSVLCEEFADWSRDEVFGSSF